MGVLKRLNSWIPSFRSSRSLSTPTLLVGLLGYYGALFFTILLLISPIVIVVGISLNSGTTEQFPPDGISLRWYVEFFQHGTFFDSFFFVSLPIAVITGLLATAIGVITAYALVRHDIPYESMVHSTILAPIVVPAVILGLALMLFFARFGLEWPFGNLVAGHTLRTIPYTTLIAIVSLSTVDKDLELAARNLGATKLQAFRKVTLPLMKSGLIAGFLMAFVISFADVQIALFLSSGKTLTLPVAMFLFLVYDTSPIIAAVGTLQILLVLILMLIIGRLVGFDTIVR